MFKYQARDSAGRLVTGERFAQSMESLSTQLFNEGLIPVGIQAQKKPLISFMDVFKKKKVVSV